MSKTTATNKIKLFLAGCVALLIVLAVVLKDDAKPAAAQVAKDTDAIIVAQNKVRERLKSPATADFEMFAGKASDQGHGRFVVRDHVDSQNSFGAKVRSEYLVELQFNGGEPLAQGSWSVVKLEIQ